MSAVMEHPADLHASVDRALTAKGLDHTEEPSGFLVPAFMPYVMSDREVLRWLADLGIQLTAGENWPVTS